MRALRRAAILAFVLSSFGSCVSQRRHDKLKERYDSLKTNRTPSELTHPGDLESPTLATPFHRSPPDTDLRSQADSWLVSVVRETAQGPVSGLGVVIDVRQPAGASEPMASVLTSRYLVDGRHPAAGTFGNPSGQSPFVKLKWRGTGTETDGFVKWVAPYSPGSPYLYDMAIVLADLPEGGRIRPPRRASATKPDSRVTVLTQDEQGDVLVLSSPLRLVQQRNDRWFDVESLRYLLGDGTPIQLGSPAFDEQGALVGVVDGVNYLRSIESADLLRRLLENLETKADAKIAGVRDECKTYYEGLRKRIDALQEPEGIAALVACVAEALTGDETLREDVPGALESHWGLSAERARRFLFEGEIQERVLRRTKPSGVGWAVTGAKWTSYLAAGLNVAELVGGFIHAARVKKMMQAADEYEWRNLERIQSEVTGRLASLATRGIQLWEEMCVDRLKNTTCSLSPAWCEPNSSLSRTILDREHAFAFRLPTAEWNVSRRQDGALLEVTRGLLKGAVSLHPDCKGNYRWSLLGLSGSVISAHGLTAEAYDPRERKRCWESPADQGRRWAVFERGGVGYVWRFTWPAGSAEPKADISAILDSFRFEFPVDPAFDPDLIPSLKEMAGNAFRLREDEAAVRAYSSILLRDPDEIDSLAALVRILCASEIPGVARPSLARYYAAHLQRLVGPSHPANDAVALSHWANGDLQKAIEIEERLLASMPETHALHPHVRRVLERLRFWNSIKSLGLPTGRVTLISEANRIGRDIVFGSGYPLGERLVYTVAGAIPSPRTSFSIPLSLEEKGAVSILVATPNAGQNLNLHLFDAEDHLIYRMGGEPKHRPHLSATDVKHAVRAGSLPAGRYAIVVEPAGNQPLSFQLDVTVVEHDRSGTRLNYRCLASNPLGIYPTAEEGRLVVDAVIPGGPAHIMGVKPKDLINALRIADAWTPVRTFADFAVLHRANVGDRVTLQFFRDGQEFQRKYRVAFPNAFALTP